MKIFLRCLLAISLFASHTAWPDSNEQAVLKNFKYAPFPLIDSQAATFFDVLEEGRRGRNSPRGGLLWEDTTYHDNRVLLAKPAEILNQKNLRLVVFLHGNQSVLDRDVLLRQQVPAQLAAAGINAYLVAPQFALDALDSSPGNFAQKNYFSRFIKEAAIQIGRWQNDNALAYQLNRAPIIVVAYSGGYLAAANILSKGGVNDRIKGVILLDSLYGQEDIFAKWIKSNYRRSFFLSAYTEPARASNELLQNLLRERDIEFETTMPNVLGRNNISFIQLSENTVHQDLLTQAWNNEPLADLLRKTDTVR